MPHSYGYRAHTRSLFSRPFRQHGQINMTPYLTTFKVGEFVDVHVNGAVHSGMPYRAFVGKTGKIWNVTPRAVGVEINKRVKSRIMKKRFHIRIEHVQKSNCQADLIARRKQVAAINKHNAANPKAKKAVPKRGAHQPRPGYTLRNVKKQKVETVGPIPYALNI